MKFHWVILFPILLSSACATQKSSTETKTVDNRGRSIPTEQIIIDLMRRNGENLYCDQPDYPSCFNISKAQCLSELDPFIDGCADQALEKYPVLTGNNNQAEEMGEAFGACVLLKHFSLQQENIVKISQCLQNFNPSEEEILRSLIGPAK